MAEINLRRLRKAFDDFVAVEDTDLTVPNGAFFVLLGPSGCGKTTTLRMIAGLELPTSGEIRLGSEDVTFKRARERDIAFVFQLFALYPHMTVRGNIAFPLRTQGTPRAEIRRRVEETARLLRIDHLLDRPVGGLAGGDRQRVALGRAIVRRPLAFLMDEPLGTLDAAFRELMCEELKALHDRIGATTVYVTHDQVEAMAMGDVVAVMNAGRVLQSGPPHEIYHRPRSLFVASFIGSPAMNLVDAEGGLEPGAAQVRVAGTEQPMPRLRTAAEPGAHVYGVRPEHVALVDESALRAEVVAVDYLGARQVVTLDGPAGRLRAKIGNGQRVDVGERVGLAFDGAKAILFDARSGNALPSTLFEADHHG
ncbi:MAG: ABC transporter ATP-binding protein [Pseudomonadota bacterium]